MEDLNRIHQRIRDAKRAGHERPRLRLRCLIQIVTPRNELVDHAAGTSHGPNSGVSRGGQFKYDRNFVNFKRRKGLPTVGQHPTVKGYQGFTKIGMGWK